MGTKEKHKSKATLLKTDEKNDIFMDRYRGRVCFQELIQFKSLRCLWDSYMSH